MTSLRHSLVLGATLLSGCGSLQRIDQIFGATENTNVSGTELVKVIQETQQPKAKPVFITRDENWVDPSPIGFDSDGSSAQLNCEIDYSPQRAGDLFTLADVVSRQCRLRVRVTADALSSLRRLCGHPMTPPVAMQTNPPASPSVPPGRLPGTVQRGVLALPGGAPLTGVPGAAETPQPQAEVTAAPLCKEASITAAYKGTVRGLLDAVTARLGLSWRMKDGAAQIHYLDTRTFRYHAIPGSSSMDTSVISGNATPGTQTNPATPQPGVGPIFDPNFPGGVINPVPVQPLQAAGASPGTTGSSQATSLTMRTSIWDDVERTIRAILSPAGRVSISPSTGTITVTDAPEVLDQIATYIDGENRNLTKQVILNVRVLSVTLNDADSLGIDWNAVYALARHNTRLSLSNIFAGEPGSVSGGISIVRTNPDSTSPWEGSNAVVKALAQQGRIAVVTSPSVTTLNLQPVPVQVARQTSYLASVSRILTPNAGTSTSLTPGTVTSGFNMNLLPYVTADNTILLQYSINISALNQIRQITSGENTIEIPELDNRIFSQKVRMHPGETLILSGFEQTNDNVLKSGVGEPGFWLAGGGAKRRSVRDVIVILITPVVLD